MRIPCIGLICAVTLVLAMPGDPAVAEESCLDADKTGMAWVHPFNEALEAAKTRGRLLMIKPVAFGTTPDGGW